MISGKKIKKIISGIIHCFFQKRLECALVISQAFRMEGETSKIKKLASVERLNLKIFKYVGLNTVNFKFVVRGA